MGSPGDLIPERHAAKAVVQKFNHHWADDLGYQIELIGWEDTTTQAGRPQATINLDLQQCVLFIGVIWKRWGTPPDKSGKYTSGFEEEFDISVKSFKERKRPDVSLFFKDIDTDTLRDPGEGLKKVIDFRKKIVDEKEILFEAFLDTQDFEAKFERCITRYVQRLKKEDANGGSGESQTLPNAPVATQSSLPIPTHVRSLIPKESAEFSKEFIATLENAGDGDKASPVDVARWRLLGCILGGGTNDDAPLGVHDSNLLFANCNSLKLSNREIGGLVDSGLAHISQENVPVWHWLYSTSADHVRMLSTKTLNGPTERRSGALLAMKAVREGMLIDEIMSRDVYLESWLSPDTPPQIRSSALSYLEVHGEIDDIQAIREEYLRSDYQTASLAIRALLRIALRSSQNMAVELLLELKPQTLPNDLVANIFSDASEIDESTLIKFLEHPNSDVRLVAVRVLRENRKLTQEWVDRLILDSAPLVRLEAIKAQKAMGIEISIDEIKKILSKPASIDGFGGLTLGSLWGRDPTGETLFKKYRKDEYFLLELKKLEQLSQAEDTYDWDATFALYERQFNKYGDSLREHIDEQFSSEIEAQRSKYIAQYGETSAIVDLYKSNIDQTRKRLLNQSVEILCRKGNAQDLKRVRIALKTDLIEYSESVTEYLSKFGDWSDVPFIMNLAGASAHSLSILSSESSAVKKNRHAAKALIAIAGKDVSRLLNTEMKKELMAQIIVELSDARFRSLMSQSVHKLFMAEKSEVRKAAVLKAIRVLSKQVLAKLLNEYVSKKGSRYYNVIHWLDFGVSVPRSQAVTAVDEIISATWRH